MTDSATLRLWDDNPSLDDFLGFDAVVDPIVNVRAIFLMCKHVVPIMKANGGGSIVNTGSGWGLKGGGQAISYCASKGAVVNMTRALAIDHGPDGIRVNSVNPGDVDTGMLLDEARQLGQDQTGFLAEAAEPVEPHGTAE